MRRSVRPPGWGSGRPLRSGRATRGRRPNPAFVTSVGFRPRTTTAMLVPRLADSPRIGPAADRRRQALRPRSGDVDGQRFHGEQGRGADGHADLARQGVHIVAEQRARVGIGAEIDTGAAELGLGRAQQGVAVGGGRGPGPICLSVADIRPGSVAWLASITFLLLRPRPLPLRSRVRRESDGIHHYLTNERHNGRQTKRFALNYFIERARSS